MPLSEAISREGMDGFGEWWALGWLGLALDATQPGYRTYALPRFGESDFATDADDDTLETRYFDETGGSWIAPLDPMVDGEEDALPGWLHEERSSELAEGERAEAGREEHAASERGWVGRLAKSEAGRRLAGWLLE